MNFTMLRHGAVILHPVLCRGNLTALFRLLSRFLPVFFSWIAIGISPDAIFLIGSFSALRVRTVFSFFFCRKPDLISLRTGICLVLTRY